MIVSLSRTARHLTVKSVLGLRLRSTQRIARQTVVGDYAFAVLLNNSLAQIDQLIRRWDLFSQGVLKKQSNCPIIWRILIVNKRENGC